MVEKKEPKENSVKITSIERKNELLSTRVEGHPLREADGKVLGRVVYQLAAFGDGWSVTLEAEAVRGVRVGLAELAAVVASIAESIGAFSP